MFAVRDFPHPALPLCRRILVILSVHAFVLQAHAAEFVAPYVQTAAEDVELILDLAEVGPDDYLIDLGSGDGRFVIAAGKRGAMAHGVELDPDLVRLAQENARKAEVTEKVAFTQGDIFEANIRSATVVTIYLFPEANIQLRPKLLAELRPGTRLVSNSFHMGDWEPDRKAQGRTSGGALLWIIPADVSGLWRMTAGPAAFSFVLEQKYQKVAGRAAGTADESVVSAVRLQGSRIWFAGQANGSTTSFSGQVDGDTMRGFTHIGEDVSANVVEWEAQRVGKDGGFASKQAR